MTIPGVDATVALSIVAAVGDFTRFRTPEKLVAYLGLNPRVRQSGGQPASHGRITKAGSRARPRDAGRGGLVGVQGARARCARSTSGSRARRGMQIAVVATARKLAVLCWHLIIKGEDYAYAQPSLVAHKRRKLELRAGLPAAPRPARARPPGYSLQAVRAAERDLAAQAETAYRTMVAAWQPTRPAANRGAESAADRGWTWPPPMGRDSQGPLGATRRGRADSPTPCSSRRGRPRPPPPERYAGPRRGQGRSSSLRCGRSTLTPAAGRRYQAAAAGRPLSATTPTPQAS